MQITEKDRQEIMQVIEEYNAKIDKSRIWFNSENYMLSLVEAGIAGWCISIGEINLYNSNDNDREYNENTDKYEPWRKYIKRKIQELTDYQKAINKLINRK
jgi:hypothetical protein